MPAPKRKAAPPPPAASPAAEADARNMLLAGGIKSEPDRSAMQQLLADLGRIDSIVYTVEEFCEAMKISRPTFYRMQRKGQGPTVTHVAGAVRIRKEHAVQWLNEQPVSDQVPPKQADERKLPPRRLRKVLAAAPVKKQPDKGNVPRLFDPPPKKRGRKRVLPVTATGDDDDE